MRHYNLLSCIISLFLTWKVKLWNVEITSDKLWNFEIT